jgi:hypothetical protein
MSGIGVVYRLESDVRPAMMSKQEWVDVVDGRARAPSGVSLAKILNDFYYDHSRPMTLWVSDDELRHTVFTTTEWVAMLAEVVAVRMTCECSKCCCCKRDDVSAIPTYRVGSKGKDKVYCMTCVAMMSKSYFKYHRDLFMFKFPLFMLRRARDSFFHGNSSSVLSVERGRCDCCYQERDVMRFSRKNWVLCSECAMTKKRDDVVFDEECEACSNKFRSHNLVKHRGRWYCKWCFEDRFCKCTHCGRVQSKEGMTSGICRKCVDEHYFVCDQCRTLSEKSGKRVDNRAGKWCGKCYDGVKGFIEDYGHSVPYYIYSLAPRGGEVTYGVELEVQHKDYDNENADNCEVRADNNVMARELVSRYGDYLHCTYDGSVSRGFEIIFHPMTLEWLRHRIGGRDERGHRVCNRKVVEDVLGMLRSKQYVSHGGGNCGMHVNMGKHSFKPFTLARFMLFINKIAKQQTFTISQRSEGQIEQYAQFSNSSARSHIIKASHWVKTGGCSDNRYSAINLQNSNRAEVRIFRGTLKNNRFFKNVEFCDAVLMFARSNTIMSWEAFKKFVQSNGKLYANLMEFIKEKGL